MTRAFPEQFGKQTPTEFFDNIADLEKRYHQLREMPYNNERTWNERTRFPYARLVVGIDRQNPDGAVAIIQVRNGVNYLCDDYRGPYADRSDAQIPQMAKKLVEVIGVDRVRPHTYTQRDGYTWVQVEKDMHITESTKLDIALVKPYFKTICFTLLLPIVFAAINRSLLTGVSFAMCFIAMTTGYTFSITEKNSMDRLFGILPVRKSELVIGRYVFVLAMGLLSLIISLIAQPLVLKVLGETVGVFDIVTAAIAGVFLFALYTVFQIPGYYKYGSIKGRVFMYIPVAGFLVTLLLLSKMPAIGNSIISSVESSPILPVLIVFFSIVAMYAVSIILSIRIMKKKEM